MNKTAIDLQQISFKGKLGIREQIMKPAGTKELKAVIRRAFDKDS